MGKQPYHAFDGREPFEERILLGSGDGVDVLKFLALLIGFLALVIALHP